MKHALTLLTTLLLAPLAALQAAERKPAKPNILLMVADDLGYRDMKFQNRGVDERGQIKSGAPREQLYDLDKDVGQHKNLAASQPERLKTLRERFTAMTKGSRQQTTIGD